MMDNQDRAAIEGLFEKMEHVARDGAPRDPEAERLIAARLASQPGAAYYMAQTIIVQEQALEAAQRKIEAAEAPPAARQGGGFISSVWGNRDQSDAPMGTPRRGSVPSFGRGEEQGAAPGFGARAGGGGGFLAGAAQTAMGVAGGVLLGSAIGGMFGGNEAQAGEASKAAETEPSANDGGNDAGGNDAGGDEGGGGMFGSLFGGGDDGGGDGGGE